MADKNMIGDPGLRVVLAKFDELDDAGKHNMMQRALELLDDVAMRSYEVSDSYHALLDMAGSPEGLSDVRRVRGETT